MIYFVSDIHLGHFSREKDKLLENIFIDFLDNIKHNCTKLFLLGDIFDYWFEYKNVIPSVFYRTLSKFSELIDYGIEIEYLIGNHDFGHNKFFKNEFNIEIIKTDIIRTINNKKIYLSHGDGKAYNDKKYLLIKKILRNKTCQTMYSKIHPDFGISLALKTSRKSREVTSKKNYGEKDGMLDFAKQKINEGFDYVIMGHRHKAEIVNFKNGQYINLGEWFEKPSFATFDGSKVELIFIKK